MKRGLAIPCVLLARLNGYSVRNHIILQKYEELITELYIEPKNEEIIF